jgi:two-component system, response regulator PdtaR
MNQLAVSTVLTVEDDPIVRDDLRTLLEREGFEVLAGARDGVEAVELAREHRPDVILLDLSLPRLDGVEAALRIREERDVPIVALTGYSEMLVERALEAGAAGYVRKPFAGGEVVTALRDAIRSHAERSVDARRDESRRALVKLAELLGLTGEIGVELEERAFADGKVWRIIE